MDVAIYSTPCLFAPHQAMHSALADPILEVDRTANMQQGSGTAGSDHEGSAVDMIEALVAAHQHEEDHD